VPRALERILSALAVCALSVCAFAQPAQPSAEQLRAVRIWPAPEYTRVTEESAEPLQSHMSSIKDPERLILDLEGVDFASVQQAFSGKLAESDPYIGNLRVGRYKPGVVRVVLDLKTEVKPQIFTLAPVGEYGHRLVLDIYPAHPVDPILALLQKSELATEPSPGQLPDDAEDAKPAPKAKRPGKERRELAAARLVTIAVDAGHGGEDPGALGRHGSREKDVTLRIARRLKALVDAEPNMRALLTRDGDYFLPLAVRVDKARKVKADLFVSIHADAFVRPDARGSSVFALSDRRATSEMARILAKQENESDLIGGSGLDGKDDYVKRTILDLWQTGTIDHSLRLGGSVLKRLGTVNTLHKPHVEQASFKVLTAPNIPSILVETAFISNPEEEKRLNDQDYQDRLAQAVLDGIRDYFAKHPPRPASPLALN